MSLDEKAILSLDPWLEPFLPAIVHRYQSFLNWKNTIQEYEGGYESFTKGFLKFGFIVNDDASITYREWAPNAIEAVLIGDFSSSPDQSRLSSGSLSSPRPPDDWHRTSHPLTKNKYGVWEITLPPRSPGVCAIPHDSKLKVGDLQTSAL